MTRYLCAALCAVLATSPLAAQAPDGWKLRADQSTSASDPDAPGPIRFTKTAVGFHAVNPQAAVYWHPANAAAGAYSLKATFTLMRPSGHTNFYGLVFGGRDLEGPRQTYLYFLVAQDGTWLVKRRAGDATTEDVVAKTPHAAVRKPAAGGTSTNALEVRVLANSIEYLVNGTRVHTMPRSGAVAQTDGLYGVRVNHQLEVQFEGLALAKL
jgi:hypothetical protein